MERFSNYISKSSISVDEATYSKLSKGQYQSKVDQLLREMKRHKELGDKLDAIGEMVALLFRAELVGVGK